ncbi:alpha/beta fold hydrolase [Nonlabens sp. Asnod2-A12]|uniref:alpha/beta fold hydrolase n=1 Tax=Nonlabens sp. Asnod2-A12 TaxID=3160578 RepID=UPI003863C860
MKNIFLIVIGGLFLTSCSSLQYRLNDEEITTSFSKIDALSHISYVAIDSLDLNVRIQSVTKEDNDINLVFLHGSPSSLSAWRRYLKDSLLYNKANLHAIDRPGYGYSNFGESLTSIDTQAKVMNEVVSSLNLKNMIVIGASYGGPLAARLSLENENVKGVMMVSPAIDPDNEQRVWQSDLTQYWLTRWLVPTGYHVAGDEKTTHAQELALIEKDWEKVTVPIMHIHGDKDDLVPYINVSYTERVFPNIEIITIPNTGHEISWGRPELVKPYIIEFMKRIKRD